RQAIVITKEIWHSPDLNLDISTTRDDPRFGIQTRKLSEISRSEPDPQLFAIPADYQVLDNRARAKE
ncbi:MAG: hypothetical protein WCD27_06050, partial [Candidatus Acidiferrales bacterium]